MKFNVILEDRQKPGFFKFVTVEDCVDMDDCIEHLFESEPDFKIEKISSVLVKKR